MHYIYTTKTAIARSIGKSDDTIRRMIRDGEVIEAFTINRDGKESNIGYILASKVVQE